VHHPHANGCKVAGVNDSNYGDESDENALSDCAGWGQVNDSSRSSVSRQQRRGLRHAIFRKFAEDSYGLSLGISVAGPILIVDPNRL
jgi:hypothetical protein